MKNTSIQITHVTKSLLDDLKGKFSYTTYDNCVNSLANFIVTNGIDPTDISIGNFKNSLLDLELRLVKNIANTQKQLTADNKSLRTWVGAIERDYLVPIRMNLDVVDKFVKFNIQNETSSKIELGKFENPINKNLNQSSNDDRDDDKIKGLYQQILDAGSKSDELELENNRHKKTLNKIFNAAKIEHGGMLSKGKITIEMDIEDWENLKKK